MHLWYPRFHGHLVYLSSSYCLWLECSTGRLVPLIPGSSQPSLLVPATTLNIWLVLADLLIFVRSYFPCCCCKSDTYFFNYSALPPTPPTRETYCRSGSEWVVYFISEVKTRTTWPCSGGDHLLSWPLLGKHSSRLACKMYRSWLRLRIILHCLT